MSPISPKVNNRLSTEDRIVRFVEVWRDSDLEVPLPTPYAIALITGARSESIVKSVLWDMDEK